MLWFRNLLIYRISPEYTLDSALLESQLSEKPARPCGPQELSTFGFVAPIGKGEDAPLVHGSQRAFLICTKLEERKIPAKVIKDELDAKIEEIEQRDNRKVGKKEKTELKEDIIQALLPRAFVNKSQLYAYIDLELGLIFVDTSSASKADMVLSTLREVIGSLPVTPLTSQVAPSAVMTEWVKNKAVPLPFHILDCSELSDTHEDGGKIKATRQDLSSEEIQNHLNSGGKIVTELALGYIDQLSFSLNSKMVVKGIRFEDLLQEQASQDGGDDFKSQMDASFTLMALTFREFIPALIQAMGGEVEGQGI